MPRNANPQGRVPGSPPHYIVLCLGSNQGGLVLVDDGVGARALLPESVSTENGNTAGR
jgi:hypothetical protein